MNEEELENSTEEINAPETTGEENLAPRSEPVVEPRSPTTAEELVRQAQILPRLPSTADEPRGFRLNYGEVHSKPGTRYNLLGQKIYDPPPLSYDGRLTLNTTPQENQTSAVSRNLGIQTRGLNVIASINQSTLADFSTELFNRRLGSSLQDSLGNSAQQGLALTGNQEMSTPRTVQSTLLDTLTNMRQRGPAAVNMPAASRASSGVYLSSYAQRNANPQSVLALYNEIAKLKSTLGNGVDSIEIQYADRVVNGQLQRVAVGVRVGIRNYNELYDGLGLYGQSAYTSVGRSHYFNFTVNQTGQVIETTSNRLITGSLISSSGGAGGRLSAFNTVKGLISTYVKSAELEAKHGVVDSLFNAMVSRGDYSPLGRVFAEMLISRDETFIINKGNRFNRTVETILNAKGFSGLEADLNKVIDSISAKGLNYYHTIGQVMQDMNNDPQAVKEAYSKMYSQRKAALRRALDPLYKIASFRGPSFESSVRATLKNLNLLVSSDTEVFEYSVDGKQIKLSIFDDLKAAALGMSPVGKAKYDFRKNQASSSILQLLMSPYLMPHETGYSGAQAVARLGFYNMSETRGGRSMYQILPAMYRHGFAGTQPGEYYKPIAAQSAKSSLVKYTAGYFNFDAASHKVVEFFDNRVLFRGMPSLMRSSLKEVKLHLERLGYNNAQEVIREFRTRMNLKEDEDENTEILLTPFRKPEQISQRLKNLVGGRSMYELSTSVRSALKEQNQSAINNLFEDTQDGLHFSASYLAGEVPANLNTIQYEYVLRERAKIIQELNYDENQLVSDVNKQLDVSNRLVKRLREIQLDPFKDVGGLVIGRATRRAAVGMGISALSDFMFVNQEYLAKSSFGYSHVVNYNIPKTTSTYYEGVGNVRQVDPYFEAKVERYKQVFKAGTTIYMNAHELKNEGALAALNTAAGVFRQQLKDRGLSGESLTRAIRTQLLNNFSALQSVDITEEGLQATLKPGAYRFDSTGIMRFEGEIVDGSLRIGLLPKRGKYTSLGGGVLSQRYASEFIDLKVAGLSRGITDGIAFVLSDVKFKPGQGGGVEPEVALTILTDFATGSRHDSLTKGPIVATKGYDAFNDAFRSSLLSRQAKADPIYGVMGPSVFKSYNYESGLEILRDPQSKTSLLNIDSREKVFLLSLAFLDKNNGELKQALLDYIDNSSLKNKPALKLLVQSYQGSGPKKLQNLLINAPDVITLLGGGQLNKVGGYLAKLLESGNFNDFESKLQSIFQRADESSVEIIRQVEGGPVSLRTYRESDFSVRSAALIADILYTTQQIINPNLQLGKITGGKPLEGYKFVGADGQVRVQDFVTNAAFREATLDIAQKLGYRNKFLPSQKTLNEAIERGLQPGDKLYKKVQELLLAVHYSFQTSPFIERAVNLMPSRVLYPTGSEDAVGLEYHYSLSMSQREFNQLRAIGVDVESFSQVQAAYSTIVTHGSANRISRLMEVVSPFGADRTQVNLSQKVAQLLDNYNRFSAEHKFLGSGRNLSLLDQLVRQLTLGSDKYNTTLSQYELVNQAINYQQPGTQYEQTRALNVINVLEPGRLQLESLQDSQLVDLARLYNIHSLNRAEIIEGLRALGPITGQAVQYYGLSSNVDDPRRLSVSRAISEYAETRTAFGGDLLYGLSEDSVRTFLQNNAVDYQTFKSAIDLVTNPITGRLATGKNTYDIVNRLQEHDANIEKMLANAAGANKTKTYVQALERIASGAQQVINYSDNALQKERAFRLRQEIFQTRSILLPSMEVFGSESDPMIMLYDPSEGRRHITYEATPIIQLGLDVLSEIPTEFESYTNEVIRNQQRIRELLPEFQSIMGRLHEGPILKATVEEAKLIKEIQSLAIQSQSDVEQIFGSVLQQRAENEKIKYPGASFIAVASYLATPSEAFTGYRVFGGSLGVVVTDADKLKKDQYDRFIYSSTSRLDDLDDLEDPGTLDSIRHRKLEYFKKKLEQQKEARELYRLIHAEVDFSYDPRSYAPPAFAEDVASFLDLLSSDDRFSVYRDLLEAEQDRSPGIKLGVKQEMDLNRQQKAILDEQIELLTAERDRLNRRLEKLKVAEQGFTGSGGLVKNLANVKAEMLGLKDSLYAQHLEAKEQRIKLNEQANYLYNSIIATLKRTKTELINERKLLQRRLTSLRVAERGVRGSGGLVKNLTTVKSEILALKDSLYAQSVDARNEKTKLQAQADALYTGVISRLNEYRTDVNQRRREVSLKLKAISKQIKDKRKELDANKKELNELFQYKKDLLDQRNTLNARLRAVQQDNLSPIEKETLKFLTDRAASLQSERKNVQLQLKEINKTLKLEYKDLHQQEISIKQQLKSVRAQLKSIHPESSKIQALSLTLVADYITEKPEAVEIVKGWYLNKTLQASERKLVTDLENIRTLRTQGNPARQTLLDKLEDINKREKQNKEVLDKYYAEPLVEALSKIGTSISLLDESISEKLKYKSNLHEMISQMQSYQSGLRERTDKLADELHVINTELSLQHEELKRINDKRQHLKLISAAYTKLLNAFKLQERRTYLNLTPKLEFQLLSRGIPMPLVNFGEIKNLVNRIGQRKDKTDDFFDAVSAKAYEKTITSAISKFKELTYKRLRVLDQLESNSEKTALTFDDIKITTDHISLVNSELRFQYDRLNSINDRSQYLKLISAAYTKLLNAFKLQEQGIFMPLVNFGEIRELVNRIGQRRDKTDDFFDSVSAKAFEKTITSAIHRFNLIRSKKAGVIEQLRANRENRSEVIAQIKPIHSRLKKLKQVRAALNQRFYYSLKPLKENLYARLNEAEEQKRYFESIRRGYSNLEESEVYRSDLSRRLSSKNLSVILKTSSGLQQVHVFGRPFLEGIGLHAQGGAFIIQDRLRQHVVSIRKRAAAGDAEARELLNALTNPELVAGLSEKNKVFYDEFKNIVESKKSAEDTQTRYQKELSQIQEAIAKYNPIETYRATGTPNLSKSHTRAAGLELALLSRGIPSPVKKTYSAGEVREFAFRKKDADIIEREKIKYNSRVAAFQDYTKYISDRQGQAESAAVERISQMTGYVHRAGGLTGASQGTNMLHDVKDIPEIISRGEANSNQLTLTLDGNHTALIVSMYGRFGVHGGDFDGDSYQLIFGYRDIQESLLKAIRNRDTIRSSLATIENTDASDSTYLAYLDNKKADLRQSLQSAQAAVDDLVNRVNEFSTVTAGRIKQGMRRHVAAFAGIPLSIIMNEDYYSDEQISNMIEQQRGITPGLTDINSDYASTGDYFRLAGRLADRLGPTATKNQALTEVDTLFSGEDTSLVNQFKLLLSASSAFEGDVSNIKEKFFEEISEMTNLQVALATANKFIESATGSIFDLRTFEALQTSIGSVGTSLIGEGYNAITTMIGRSVMARTLGTVIQDSIQTPSPDSFVNRLIQKLDNLGSDPALTNIKESAQNVKGKFVDYELERTQHFTQERGQRLQMNLGLIQQIIRDSLKPKEKQGVIDALVKGNTSVRDKLLDESLDDTTRTNILRDFLSTQAVTSMVDMISPKALDKNIDVTKTTTGGLINTFGAIFLLADYTREQNPAKFLAQGSGDRYNVLRRYRDIYTNPDTYKMGGHDLDIVTQLRLEDQEFVGKIKSDDNYLVRQAITDMINMATAQEAFSKYAGYDEGTWIDQAKARRESYLKALADVNSDSPLYFKNEQHRVAVMRSMHISDLDINAYKQNQIADHTFDLESARLSLLNVSYIESTYLGMTEADVEFSRKVTRAAGELKNMSYETKESFVPFIAAQNENAVAIQQMARRGKLQDPVAMRDFQVGSAARLFDAIDRVNSNLTVKYGNLENAMSKADVYQAYSQIADLSGVFDLNAQDSETLSFALMASKEDSQALFKHLANVSAGQAYVLEKGRQLDSIYEKYQDADDSSRLDLDRQRSLIDEDLYLLKEALNNNVNSPELQSRLAEVGERERLRMTEESKGRRMASLKLRDELKALPTQQSMQSFGVMNTLELFAAPVVGSVLMQQPLNERLVMGTYDILQGLATIESFSSNTVAAEANRLFRISRFKDHMMQNESLLLGAAQGFLAESVYMGLASFVSSRAEALSQRLNPKGRQAGGGIGGVVAEAAVTAAALAFTRRGNEYGIDNEPYRNLAAEALLGIADETEEAVSSWLDRAMDIQVETEDQIVTFDFDPSITPSQYEERIVTGWVDMTYSDDSIGPNSFDSIYYEAGSYLGE